LRIIGEQALDMAEPLWRYFKTERFLELLQSNHLYFSAARQFEDHFEGAVAILPQGFPIDPQHANMKLIEEPFEELRRLTKVSCWHRAAYESDAMWKLYAGARKGVAIRTNAERIQASAKPFQLKPEYGSEDLWAGNVNYVDLVKEWRKNLEF
jgi:hypothetical protein